MVKQIHILRTFISAAVIIFALPFSTSGVFAQAPTNVGTKAAVRQEAVISRLKTRADNEITRRTGALTKLVGRINDIKRLTADQKTSLTTQVQDQTNSLNTLKAKIDADTDIATLRADVQSIVKSYRIFALFIPRTYLVVHADRLLDIADGLTVIQTKLQTRIDAVKSAGGDTAEVQKLMTDMTTKLSDAKTQATNAINTVLPLTPDGWPANKATLVNARKMLITARQDIQAAHKDQQLIRQALVKLDNRVNAKITPVGGTPKTTPTSAPTP